MIGGGDTVDGSTDGTREVEDNQHGAKVAELIAAQGGETGIVGVAPKARAVHPHDQRDSSERER